MGSITNMLEDELLDHVFNAAFVPQSPLYVALCTGDPGEAATGATLAEVSTSGTAYARTAITFNVAASRRVIQSANVQFPQASAAWGIITHWAIVASAAGAGNVYAYGDFLASFAPVAGNTPTIPSGEIEVEFLPSSGAGMTDYLAHNLLNLAFRNNTPAFPKPATYIGLTLDVLTDTDTTSASITEVSTSGTNYARKQVNPNGGATPTWDLSSGGALDNTHDITFNTPSGSWGQVVSMFISDAATAGNILCFDSANIQDQTPVANDTVLFPAGALDISLT